MEYELRKAEASDKAWLYSLHEEAYRDVVIQQFGAWEDRFQRENFERKWRSEDMDVILVEGRPAGVLSLRKEGARWRIEDIKIAADIRSNGLGARVIRDCVAKARQSGASVALQVLRENRRTKALYERLGFTPVKATDTHIVMEIS